MDHFMADLFGGIIDELRRIADALSFADARSGAEIAALRRALAYFPACNCHNPESIADMSSEPHEQCPRCNLPEDIRMIIEGANTIAKERTDP